MEKSYLTKCDSNCDFIKNSTIEVTTITLDDGVVEFECSSLGKLDFAVDDIVYLNAGEIEAKYKYYKITYVSYRKPKKDYLYTLSANKHECKK